MNKHDMQAKKTQTATESATRDVKKGVTQGVKVDVTEGVTQGTKKLKMSKKELLNKTDQELLDMVEKAKGHTKDFQNDMNCDFSYTYLTNHLQERGFVNGWYIKPAIKASKVDNDKITIIEMKKPSIDTVRKTFTLDKDVAEKWKKFNDNIPFASVTVSQALLRFIQDYEEGKIKFELMI